MVGYIFGSEVFVEILFCQAVIFIFFSFYYLFRPILCNIGDILHDIVWLMHISLVDCELGTRYRY